MTRTVAFFSRVKNILISCKTSLGKILQMNLKQHFLNYKIKKRVEKFSLFFDGLIEVLGYEKLIRSMVK